MRSRGLRFGFSLFLLGLLSIAAVIPYALSGVAEIAEESTTAFAAFLVGMQALFSTFLLLVAIPFGIAASRGVGLGAPYLQRRLKEDVPALYRPHFHPKARRTLGLGPLGTTLLTGAVGGMAAAFLAVAVDALLFQTLQGAITARGATGTLVSRFLAVLYGGIHEEILSRFFLLSVVAWILRRAEGRREPGLSLFGMTAAIVLPALLVGVGQLALASQMGPLPGVIVTRALLLHVLTGALFGWIYWRRGLEAAMLAHGTADLLLLVVFPLLAGR